MKNAGNEDASDKAADTKDASDEAVDKESAPDSSNKNADERANERKEK